MEQPADGVGNHSPDVELISFHNVARGVLLVLRSKDNLVVVLREALYERLAVKRGNYDLIDCHILSSVDNHDVGILQTHVLHAVANHPDQIDARGVNSKSNSCVR